MAKTVHVNLPRTIRVNEDVHQVLQKWAELERRSIANLIGVIIEDAVQKYKYDEGMVKRVNS